MSKIFDAVEIFGTGSTSGSSVLTTYTSGGTKTLEVKDDGFSFFNDGKIILGTYIGVPSIATMFMNVVPDTNNYTIARTSLGNTYINGDTINYTINGAVKGMTTVGYTQFTQPFAISTNPPVGNTTLLVGGELTVEGSGTGTTSYSINVKNTASTPLMYVRDDGYSVIGNSNFSLTGGSFESSTGYIKTNGSLSIDFGGRGLRDASNTYYALTYSGDYVTIHGENSVIDLAGSGSNDLRIAGNGTLNGKGLYIKAYDGGGWRTGLKYLNNNTGLQLVLGEDGLTKVAIGLSGATERLEVSGNTKLSTTDYSYRIGPYTAVSMSQGAGATNIALGNMITIVDADNGGAVAIGQQVFCASDGIAIGLSSTVGIGTSDGIAIGRESSVTNASIRGVAIGRQSSVTAGNAFAIGNYTQASQDNTIIIGNNSLGPKPNIGIGTSTPSAKLQVKSEASLSNYALKITNSADTIMLSVRNDNLINIGSATTSAGTATTVTAIGVDADGNIVKATSGGGYRVYTALITQTGTSDPVAFVLENSIGDIVWTRSGVGNYFGTLVGAFASSKVLIVGNSNAETGGAYSYNPIGSGGLVTGYYSFAKDTDDAIIYQTISSLTNNAVEASTLLPSTSVPIEIRVYN